MDPPLSIYISVFNFIALSVSAKVPPAENKIAWVFTVQFGFLFGQREGFCLKPSKGNNKVLNSLFFPRNIYNNII